MHIRFFQYALLALPFVQADTTILNVLSNTLNNTINQLNTTLEGLVPSSITSQTQLDKTLADIRKEISEISQLEETFAGLLEAVVATYVPTSLPDALAEIQRTIGDLQNANTTIENVAQAILNGVSVTDLTQNVLAGYGLSNINSYNNVNPPSPVQIYPKKQPNDAPYNIPEDQLRAAIYIPPTFSYDQNKRPILFVPGTGAYGGVNFISNLGKLLGNDPRFDPVYLNVPGAMLNDTQINSEYIAYAINYLSAITGSSTRLAVISWSQGGLDTQWAFQYWPSTRSVVEDFIPASPDFHGTTLAYFLDPAFPNIIPNPPGIIQQEYDSNFVRTLRAGGGGSPYVPSTSVWSITDEIVQPQYSPYASAAFFTQDLPGTPNTNPVCPVNANIAYTNNQIQTVCQGQPAGSPYTHEGVLYHPLTYALALDALTNDGPGRIDRIDLNTVCAQLIAPGLSLTDVLATEGLIPLALVNILLYPGKVLNEPAVQSYAIQANANCANANNVTSTTTSSSTTVPTTTSSTLSISAKTTATRSGSSGWDSWTQGPDGYATSTPTAKYDYTTTVKVTRTKTVCPCDPTTTSADWSAWQ